MADPKTCPDCGTEMVPELPWGAGPTEMRCPLETVACQHLAITNLRARVAEVERERDRAKAESMEWLAAARQLNDAGTDEDERAALAWIDALRTGYGDVDLPQGIRTMLVDQRDAAVKERDDARAQLAASEEGRRVLREALEAWGRWQAQEGRALASDRWQDYQEANKLRSEFVRLYEAAALTMPASAQAPKRSQ